MKQGDLSVGDWLKSIRPPVSGAIFAMDDPMPFLVKFYRKILNKSKKTGKYLRKKVRKFFLYEKYHILSKNEMPANQAENDKLFFRQAIKDDARIIALQYADHFGEDAEKEIMRRIANEEILIVGSFSPDFDDICYLAWLSRNDSFFKATIKSLKSESSICLYRIYVPDTHRNKGIGKYALSYIEKTFLSENYKQILAFVHITNSPSLAMFKKREWNDFGSLYRLRLFGKETIRVALH